MKDLSSRHVGQNLMNDVPIGKTLPNETATDWQRLQHLSDPDIHAAVAADPDIFPTDDGFWDKAELVLSQRRATITLEVGCASTP